MREDEVGESVMDRVVVMKDDVVVVVVVEDEEDAVGVAQVVKECGRRSVINVFAPCVHLAMEQRGRGRASNAR